MTTGEAARLLDVSPDTLRTWVQRFGFPCAQVSGERRAFRFEEVNALHHALKAQLPIIAAVHQARLQLSDIGLAAYPDGVRAM